MPYGPSESNWLYGIHDSGGEHLMLRAGRPGWVITSHSVGHDPDDELGMDFRRFRVHRLGVICTLINGHAPEGTIPISSRYDRFARCCANFVGSSPGCSIWVVGDEPNAACHHPPFRDFSATTRHLILSGSRAHNRLRTLLRVRPSQELVQGGQAPPPMTEPITPQRYAECYGKCRDAIRRVPGRGADQVLVAAVAPWNTDTRYAGNEWGDWITYFRDVLEILGPDGCDGFAIHASTHESDPRRISSSATMDAPFQGRHMEFRTYRDFLLAVPISMRSLPAYITQAHQGIPWRDANAGWIQAAYDEVDAWNQKPGAQTVRALALYRWNEDDARSIRQKNRLWDDFSRAMQRDHRWHNRRLPAWGRGDRLLTLTYVEMYETPAVDGVSEGSTLDLLPPYTQLTIERSAAVQAEGRIWWYVRETHTEVAAREGWIAQDTPLGERHVYRIPESRSSLTDAVDPPQGLRPGSRARTLDMVRMRLTPGYLDKPETDIVTDVPSGVALSVLAGPKAAEGLRWWLMRWQPSSQDIYTGWMAEFTPRGVVLLVLLEDGGEKPDRQVRFAPGDLAETLTMVRLRKSPGFMDKPERDVVADIWQGTLVKIVSGPQSADGFEWWRVRTFDADDLEVRGWMAERSPQGELLLGKREEGPDAHFEPGDLAAVRYVPVRVRRSPGYLDKGDMDVLGEFGPQTTVVIQREGVTKDDLVWLRGGGITRYGEAIGWVAQRTPGGVLLVGNVDPLPGTDIPNAEIGAHLGSPYAAQCGIGQLWGENASFYRRYAYDGVELLGHNGIDFLLPGGSSVYATEAGIVAMTEFEPDGYGLYVLISHAWGESIYAHLAAVAVEPGQRIRRGDQVGVSGSSGASTGPHLHFSIRIYPYDRGDGWGGHSDPLPYLNPSTFLLPNYVLDEEYQIHRAGRRPIFPRLAPSGMSEDRPGLERP